MWEGLLGWAPQVRFASPKLFAGTDGPLGCASGKPVALAGIATATAGTLCWGSVLGDIGTETQRAQRHAVCYEPLRAAYATDVVGKPASVSSAQRPVATTVAAAAQSTLLCYGTAPEPPHSTTQWRPTPHIAPPPPTFNDDSASTGPVASVRCPR